MIILGIDPGPKESAYVQYDTDMGGNIMSHDYIPNEGLLKKIIPSLDLLYDTIVIEWIEGYGLTVGKETFETCYWVGRFTQAAGHAERLGRKAIKSHLCNTTQARDRDIRMALIDKLGEPGTKKKPGPTYGIVGDEWAALAVAVTWAERHPWTPS